MLSPFDLKNKKVEAKKRKYYDREEMDEYLEFVFENYKELYNENQELHKNIKKLDEGIQYYRSIESTMQKALVLAEKTAKETKDAALLKAEAIEKDAATKAEQIVEKAEQEYNNLKDRSVQLVQQFNQYKLQLKKVASAQLELVMSESFDVYAPELEAIQNETHSLTQEEQEIHKQEPIIKEQTISESTTSDLISSEPIEKEALENSLEKTMIIPDVKKELEKNKKEFTSEREVDILTADTIDLSDSFKKVQDEMQLKEKQTSYLQQPAEAKPKQVQDAMVLEPVDAVVTEPLDLEIPEESEKKEAPTLDSLLQSINLGKKNKKKEKQDEDPFEFLGSVDDF